MIMSVKQIIHKIDEVIRDEHTSRDKKIASLQQLEISIGSNNPLS